MQRYGGFMSKFLCLFLSIFLTFIYKSFQACILSTHFSYLAQKATMTIMDKILILTIINIMSIMVKSFIFSISASIFKPSKVASHRVLTTYIIIFSILNMGKIFPFNIYSLLTDLPGVLPNPMASQFFHSWCDYSVHVVGWGVPAVVLTKC